LQRLEMLQQLAIHPLAAGEEVFSESPQRHLDREPVDLHAIISGA
jgi:hypothetical protein